MAGHRANPPAAFRLLDAVESRYLPQVDEYGRPIVDDNLLLMLNASELDLPFTIPELSAVREGWQLLIDTADDHADHALARLRHVVKKFADVATPYRSLVSPMWKARYGD